jgi:hypothetical protein
MKIVINKCYGGFGLSEEAFELYLKKKNIKWVEKEGSSYYTIPINQYKELSEKCWKEHHDYRDINSKGYFLSDYNIKRDDKILIEVVEELGEKANGNSSELKIVEIPDGIDWEIDEYDGMESIEEKHRSWG